MADLLDYTSNEDFYKEIDEYIAETQQAMSKRQLHIVQVIRAILKTKQIGAMEIAKDANLVFTPDFDKQILEVGYEPFCKHLSAIAIRHNFVFGVSAKELEKAIVTNS